MSQVLGTGTARTSRLAKEPVVERMPAKVFFESAALAASLGGAYVGVAEATLGRSLTARAGTAVDVGKGVGAGTRARALLVPNPLTVLIMGLLYSPDLGNGELPPDQLYQNLINDQILVGAFTRAAGTVAEQGYVPEEELRQIAQQNGSVRTRVRLRIEQDGQTGEPITKSYQVGEGSGLDRVRVRFAKRLDERTWSFEDPSIKGQLVWFTDTGRGRFVQGGISTPVQLNASSTASETTVHEGQPGGHTLPPTPVPEQQGLWGLPNPAPEPLPPLPGMPIPDEQGPNIETLPIEDQDFDDFIIVDPLGVVPAIYVYFQKAPVEEYEVDYYVNFKGRPKKGLYEVDHIPSKAAVYLHFKNKYPLLDDVVMKKMTDRVASVAIPKAVHQRCSETYGGRNNRNIEMEGGEKIKQKERDASDLEAAVNDNWDANAECLKNEYGMSDEKVEEIRAKLHELNRMEGLY